MDNDNKINKLDDNLHEEVMLFLGDEVKRIHQEAEDNSYDIEKEYAKTKKNHSPINFLVLFGVFVIVIATVFFINKYISVKDEEITVSLAEFDDLNLNNLLNSVQTAQVNYDNALKEKLVIETEMETKLNDLKAEFDNNVFVLDSLNLSSKKEYNRRKNKLESEYNVAVDNVKKEYDSQLLLAQKQVDVYKEQLDEFDTVKVANAQEKEKLINSERQLKQIEINKLTKTYEERLQKKDKAMNDMRIQHTKEMRESINNVAKKYQAEIDTLDPKLSDIKARTIMNGAGTIGDFDGAALLASANVTVPEVQKDVKDFQKVYDDFKYLDNVVKNIPQKNSITDYKKATRSLVNTMSRNYVNTSVGYMNHIEEKNNEINELNTKLNQQKVQYEKNIEDTRNAYESSISNIFFTMGIESILLNAAGYENIQVFVSPEIARNITDAGIPAKIIIPAETVIEKNKKVKEKRPEVIINGIVFPRENNTYFFEVEKNKNGIPAPVDFELLKPGMVVELQW